LNLQFDVRDRERASQAAEKLSTDGIESDSVREAVESEVAAFPNSRVRRREKQKIRPGADDEAFHEDHLLLRCPLRP
jgi:hypothetical protein